MSLSVFLKISLFSSLLFQALVELQLHTGVQVQVLASWKEFGEFASMFTKAVAEAPFK